MARKHYTRAYCDMCTSVFSTDFSGDSVWGLLGAQENVTLITEINNLRQELRLLRSQIHSYETQLELNKRGQKQQAAEAKGEPMAIEPWLVGALMMGLSKGYRVAGCSCLVYSPLSSCLDGLLSMQCGSGIDQRMVR